MPKLTDTPDSLTLEPIGFVRSGATAKVEAARQPPAAAGVPGRIELLPGRHLEHAVEDLEGWDYLWVIFWFHLNRGWRPKVLPPRGPRRRRGVLATRSPHRPNPLGLSAVQLERVDGLTLHVRGADMVDGTPVLDIKPYVPYTDAHPGAASGWLEQAAASSSTAAVVDPVAGYVVDFTPRDTEQAQWIEARTGLALRERIVSLLGADPTPRPYRRIRRERDALRLMADGADLDTPLERVMSRQLTTVDQQATVGEAISRMSAGGYRHLPVVDAVGRPTGMVSVRGIVRYLVEHFPSTIYNLPPHPGRPLAEREGA